MASRHFTPRLFGFLRDLAAHNDRDWFLAHQDDYERHVREPALDFIAEAAGPLGKISPHLVADTRKVGGSLFRIQRDLRFSNDKSPYKVNTGMHFRHFMAKDVHAPGVYLNLQPRACFMGAGIWRPDGPTTLAIRTAIVEDPDGWRRVTKALGGELELGGDVLQRPPKGFDPDHPLIDDLRRKDFTAGTPLTQSEVTSADFLDLLTAKSRRAAPLMEFLCRAIEVPF